MITDYQQTVFKRYHSDKHLSEFLPTRWRQKSAGIDSLWNKITVTLCINWQPKARICENENGTKTRLEMARKPRAVRFE